MTEDEGKRKERIYIGGLDPSRGLTVELVAARLRAVKDVEILSINDDADISKMTLINADVDSFDTRNFFFLDARTTVATTSPTLSALDLLAKEYHNVKWKGSQIRVEAAKPPFLARLEEERALRVDRHSSIDSPTDIEERERGVEEKVVKTRRSLRIRKRFGEEAFRVDTRPHPLKLSHQDRYGWDTFASLHTRMQAKRQTQQNKLVERRKAERRLWASGKGSKNNNPASAEGDDLRGLSFLNRAIHIRFSDQDGGRNEVNEQELQLETGDSEDKGSVTSSSVPSSDSEASDSEESSGGIVSYVWSDDDDADSVDSEEENLIREVGSEKSDDRDKTDNSYTWSDGSDDSTEDDRSDDREQKCISHQRSNLRSDKKNLDGLEHTKAVTMDEFSGGMDFDLVQNDFKNISDEGADDSTCSASDNASEHCLEDDIRSNMGVLSKLFPNEYFEDQPLAAPIINSIGDDGEKSKLGQLTNPPSLSGAGLIMQRYDPTKESDKRFEVLSTDVSVNAKPVPGEEMTSKYKGSEIMHSTEKLSLSSGCSDEGRSTFGEAESDHDTKLFDETGSKQFKTVTSDGGTTVPAIDVYEQSKLGDIFEQAKEGGKPESFTLANSQIEDKVQNKEEPKEDIYEQDKLEGVFKQAKKESESTAEVGGFTFGFQSELPDEKPAVDAGSTASFSFGFELSNTARDDNDASLPQKCSKENSNDLEQKSVDTVQSLSILTRTEAPNIVPLQRKRRAGMTFLESDLDAYEEMFFSLNEGPRIIKDLDAMKTDEESQEQWQMERLVLTADWKRKQKSASSKKVKKVRRF